MGYTLITGATSDIGRHICHTLVEEGHTLLLSDLSEEALNEVESSLEGNHKILPLNLSNVDESRATLESYIIENGVEVTYAVFAAGIFAIKPLKLINYEFVKMNFDISVFSILMLSQVLASKKINGNNLKGIAMISSVSAVMGTKGYVIYSAVKASMLGIMKSLAAELSPNVRVNAVMPGAIRTRTTNFLYESQHTLNPRYILGDGQPSDVSNAIAFLLSEKARWITGQAIVVDGGFIIS